MNKDEIKLPATNADFSSPGLVLEPSASFGNYISKDNLSDFHDYPKQQMGFQRVNWLLSFESDVEISNSHVVSTSLVKDKIISVQGNYQKIYQNDRIKILNESDLIKLATAILRVATKLKKGQDEYAFVLCPLKGVFKPATQLLASEAIIRAEWLNYTGGSNFSEYEVGQLQKCMRNIIKKYDARQLRKFAILDTANSGHGICRLIDILNDLRSKCYPSEFWHIEVFLLSEGRIFEKNMNKLRGYYMDKFVVITNITTVESLVFEDWDSALGVKYETDSTGTYALPINEPGRYYYSSGNKVELYTTDNLRGSLDKLLADVISLEMNSNPDFKFIRNK